MHSHDGHMPLGPGISGLGELACVLSIDDEDSQGIQLRADPPGHHSRGGVWRGEVLDGRASGGG